MTGPETKEPSLDGVLTAATATGERLPILDVTHPAFRVSESLEALELEAQAWAHQQERTGWAGRLFNRFVLPRILRSSRIGRGLADAEVFLDSLTTYYLKLGPVALRPPAFNDLDRTISGSISGKLIRLRVQEQAQQQAEALTPVLRASPGRPLHLVNIAGGPASDSLNTLLLLHRRAAAPLAARDLRVHLLDLREEGPRFARAALDAWQGEGGPLHGLAVAMEHVTYDWTAPDALARRLKALPADAIVLAASEGGLFDYAEDAVVTANLEVLAAHTPSDAQVFGTLTRPDGVGRHVRQGSSAKLVPRALDGFTALAARAGWAVASSWTRPTSIGFGLVKRAP